MSERLFDEDALVACERIVLKCLGFRLHDPTAYEIAENVLRFEVGLGERPWESEVGRKVEYALELSLYRSDCSRFAPTDVAHAAVTLAIGMALSVRPPKCVGCVRWEEVNVAADVLRELVRETSAGGSLSSTITHEMLGRRSSRAHF